VARTEAPRHARRLAVPLAGSWQSMAQAFDLKGTAAKRPWDKMAAWLTPADTAPTWRRRPSVLEQWRGGKRQPVSRKQNRHHHLKAVAYVDTYASRTSEPRGKNVLRWKRPGGRRTHEPTSRADVSVANGSDDAVARTRLGYEVLVR
jgi:hypothetical protein